jgi:hypothetical protein
MPSFRVTMTIGALMPGVSPAEVLPGATAAAESFAVVEAASVNAVAGEARLTVRFTSDSDADAVRVADAVAAGTSAFAEVRQVRATRRVGSRWTALQD